MFVIRRYPLNRIPNIAHLETILRTNLLHILDDNTAPPYKGISYETVYTALYQFSMHDNDQAATFILSVVAAAAQQRRRFLASKLHLHCGIKLAVTWEFVDDETRKRVIAALQTHSVFRSIAKVRRQNLQCFIDVCLGLRPPKRGEVIAAATEQLFSG